MQSKCLILQLHLAVHRWLANMRKTEVMRVHLRTSIDAGMPQSWGFRLSATVVLSGSSGKSVVACSIAKGRCCMGRRMKLREVTSEERVAMTRLAHSRMAPARAVERMHQLAAVAELWQARAAVRECGVAAVLQG